MVPGMGCLHEREGVVDKTNFSMSVPYPKGGDIVWTCVKDDIIKGKKDYQSIGLRGFGYKLFEE